MPALKASSFQVFVLGVLLIILCEGCLPMATLQTARTEGQGNWVGYVGAGGMYEGQLLKDEPLTTFPLLETGARYGLSDNFDLSFGFSSGAALRLGGKYQWFGNNESPWASSLGFGLGYSGVMTETPLLDFIVPGYLSYHPEDWLAIYASPKFIHRAAMGSEYGVEPVPKNWQGLTMGFSFGNRLSLLVEYSYFKPVGIPQATNTQVLMGIIIRNRPNKKAPNVLPHLKGATP